MSMSINIQYSATASKNRPYQNEPIFQPLIFRGELLVDIRLKQALI